MSQSIGMARRETMSGNGSNPDRSQGHCHAGRDGENKEDGRDESVVGDASLLDVQVGARIEATVLLSVSYNLIQPKRTALTPNYRLRGELIKLNSIYDTD